MSYLVLKAVSKKNNYFLKLSSAFKASEPVVNKFALVSLPYLLKTQYIQRELVPGLLLIHAVVLWEGKYMVMS